LHNESCDDEDDIRIAAVNALLQMDADRAVPILKTTSRDATVVDVPAAQSSVPRLSEAQL